MTRKRLVSTHADMAELLLRLSKIRGQVIGFDTESSGPLLVKLSANQKPMINVFSSFLTGLSLDLGDVAVYVPCRHVTGNAPVHLVRQLLDELRKHHTLAVWNAKHELHVMEQNGTSFEDARLLDGMIAAWMVQAEAPGKKPYSLKSQALEFLGMHMKTYSETVGHHASFSELPPKEAVQYACDDAIAARKLWVLREPLLVKYGAMDAFMSQEMPFVRVLRRMEAEGMHIEPQRIISLEQSLVVERRRILDEWDFIVPGISISSSAQLQILFLENTWARGERTAGGDYKTNNASIEKQLVALPSTSAGYRAAQLRLEFQAVNKLLTTYTHKLLRNAEQYDDGRLHPNYRQTGAVTGRMSCSYPNLQQIPVRTAIGRQIRNAFIAPAEHLILDADYSQIELRLLAHFAGGSMMRAFQNNEDPHQQTASLLDISRADGKTLNFAMIYGAKSRKLAVALGCSVSRAAALLADFEKKLPEVEHLRRRVLQVARERGYVKTIGGRVRISKLHKLEDRMETWHEERAIFNAIFQGGASDIIKRASVNIYKAGLPPIVCQVHDENILYVSRQESEEVQREVRNIMQTSVLLRLPLEVDPKLVTSWADAK